MKCQVNWKKLVLVLSLLFMLGLTRSGNPTWAIGDAPDVGPAAKTEIRSAEKKTGRGNVGNDILYFITLDRFLDGEPANNIPSYAFPLTADLNEQELAYHAANRLLLEQAYDPSHRYIDLYWGGDLEGVIQKLDYLKGLGVTQIVLSPIMDHTNGLSYAPAGKGYVYSSTQAENEKIDRFHAGLSASFQGEWIKDWFEIDEHWASNHSGKGSQEQVLSHLLDQAGQRGIGIILSLQLNHTSPYRDTAIFDEFDLTTAEQWFIDNGAVYHHGERLAIYWDPNLEQLDPQGWFHAPLSIDYNRPTHEMLKRGNFAGLPDLNQTNPDVEEYLLDAIRYWLTFNRQGHQIAGLYLTQIRYVDTHFWQKVEDTIQAVNPNTVLIGEHGDGGYRNQESINRWYNQTQNYDMVNYGLSMAARRFFAQVRNWDGRSAVLREELRGRSGIYYNYSLPQQILHWILNPSAALEIPRQSLKTVPDREAKTWITFVENHDQPRLLTYEPEITERAYLSLIKFIMTSQGVPMLMYGVETGLALPYHVDHQGLYGIGGDPFNKQMMIWPQEPGWNENLYQVTRKLIRMRLNYPLLRYGDTRFVLPEEAAPDKDLFMLREPSDCSSEDMCPRILYAYSTLGGKFLLSFEDVGISHYQDVERDQTAPVFDDLIPLKLEAEEAKVLILDGETESIG